jgi:vacuolar-type H+-ATPase subunit I/STV1
MRNKKMAEKNKERFEVLLEAIQGDVKAIAEGQGILGNKIDLLDRKIDHIDRKHETNAKALHGLLIDKKSELNEKIDQVEQKLGEKIDQVESKLDTKIDQVEQKLEDKIDQVEQTIGGKIDRVEYKLDVHMKQPAHA